MENILLVRLETSDLGTFGEIDYFGTTFVTGELPWRDNRDNVSCIPTGSYEAVWCFSPRFQKYTYLLRNVPGRDGIRIHGASFFGDRSMGFRSHSDGCLGLGDGIRWADKQPFLLNSPSTTRLFQNKLEGRSFLLEISSRAPLRFAADKRDNRDSL